MDNKKRVNTVTFNGHNNKINDRLELHFIYMRADYAVL